MTGTKFSIRTVYCCNTVNFLIDQACSVHMEPVSGRGEGETIGHFRVAVNLILKAKLSAKLFV